MVRNTISELIGESSESVESAAELYHENSKIRRVSRATRIPPEVVITLGHGVKEYRHSAVVGLTAPSALPSSPVLEAIRARESTREFSSEPISKEAFSAVLFAAYGQLVAEGFHRTVPSAGGLYPLEIYLVSLMDGDLGIGCYHYNVRNHTLELLPSFADPALITDSIFVPETAKTATAFLVITALFGRSRIKYGERAYRFALLEAGHIAQNVALLCGALGLGYCPFGGFVDDEVHLLLGLDGVDEAAVYLGAIGRPIIAASTETTSQADPVRPNYDGIGENGRWR